MEKNRLNKDKAFYKYIKVIKSCQTWDQLKISEKMIHRFYKMFDDLEMAELLLKELTTQKGIVSYNKHRNEQTS